MLLLILLTLAVFIAGCLYVNFLRKVNHWKNRKIPHAKPVFPEGNYRGTGSINLGVILKSIYDSGKTEKVYGFWQFHIPTLMIIDPDLVKCVLASDFSHFDDHGVYFDEEIDPLSANLLTLGGSQWKCIRTKLAPAFTTGKMKLMFPMMLKCAEDLREVLEGPAERREVIEFKELLARFTTDVISSCAFGVEVQSLKHKNSIFRIRGKEVFESSWEVLLRNFIGFLFPGLARFFKLRIYSKELTQFFLKFIRESMEERKRENIHRNDILQMLMELRDKGFIGDADDSSNSKFRVYQYSKEKFTLEQAAAQAFIFFTAGFETSSTTTQYALYELAVHPEMQERVRKEVKRVINKYNGSITYEGLTEMEFLGRIVEETLRKYPPASNLSRICTKEYKLPGTDIVIEKGTQISVCIYGLHMDERYYPNPEVFDPDRFTEEQKAARHRFTYIPFGEGPRICIGYKFGLTQTKLGLATILSNYTVDVADGKTRIPPIYDPKSFFFAPKDGMHLKISPVARNGQ
ncbi:UNVERIFIED_CONTAM: hypothetical protein PYX00_007703 [Menopon gallinae]|uniref:Cytochrome P450 n=1 Tax=Menopon gallinae TaxID=328185 RepID=A0AAW2HKZ2_9NEOP